MSADAKALLKRFERMKSDHQLWEDQWQLIADYIHPRRGTFTTKRSAGAKQTEKLYDSTALDAHDRLAATLNGTFTSRAIKWFSLKMRDEAFDDDKQVEEWLEDCSQRMFRALNQSNFAQEIHEVYLDEVAFGTSDLFVEERNPNKPDFDGFVFRAIPLADCYIEENAEGKVNTVFRTFQLTAFAAAEKWGEKKLGKKVLDALKEGKGDTLFTFLHCVYPRNSHDPKIGVPSTEFPWASVYLCPVDVKESQDILEEGGFQEFPHMVPRWSKTAGEKYGRGPGHLALPDVKTLNKVKQITLKMMGKALDPPTVSLIDAIEGKINNVPGGNTVQTRDDGIKPLYPPGTFRESLGNEQIKSSELQASIKRMFYSDLTELPDKSYMTAFEVAKQFELLQRKLGPEVGRLENELYGPLIDRLFGIMLRRGAFSEIPESLLGQGSSIDIVYESPLAKSQRLSEVEGAERWIANLLQGAQLWPEIIDNADPDGIARLFADVLGVPTKLLRSKDDVTEMRKARNAQHAKEQQLEQDSMKAEAAGKAAPFMKVLQGNNAAA